MKRKLLSLLMVLVAVCGVQKAYAQASYNIKYTSGTEVTEGDNYFLYNIGAGKFLTEGMDWGTRATLDNAGRVITFDAVGENVYSIHTQSFSVNNGAEAKSGYLTTNGYVDTGTNDAKWQFSPVTVDGYSNAYTIKNSDTQYLYYNKTDARVNVGDYTNNNYSYWLIIPLTQRQEEVGDYSYYLQNTDFNRPWERPIWKYTGKAPDDAGGNKDNYCAEVYNGIFNVYQTIGATVPNGKYTLHAQGFYRAGAANAENSETQNAKLYINNTSSPLTNAISGGAASQGNGYSTLSGGKYIPNSMGEASTVFTNGEYADNAVTAIVTDGKMTIGVKSETTISADWTIFDNFHLKYLGTTLINDAVALPKDGPMAEDTWYAVTIPADGDYNVTATTVDDIVYTTDGTLLKADANTTVATKFSAVNHPQNLAAGTYYVKSSSAQSLSIVPDYVVGLATADVTYIQPGQTVTIAYAAAGNNHGVTLTNNFTSVSVTFNGSSIDVTSTTANGFTFTVPEELSTSTEYTLTIPANAIGYEGQIYNEAQNITFNTPAIYDGTYYLYNTYTKNYLSRGGKWATQAKMDNFGLAVYLKTSGEGTTTVQFFDSEQYLGDDGSCYTDCTESRVRHYKVSSTTGGYYKFLNTNNSNDITNLRNYLAVWEGVAVGDAREGDNLVGTSNVWDLQTYSKYMEQVATYEDGLAAAAAESAGISATTKDTKEALEKILEGYYKKESISIQRAEGEQYQNYPVEQEAVTPLSYHSETLTGLTPGLYKVSVKAFQRAAHYDWVNKAGGARGNVYLKANDKKVQLKSVMENPSDEAYSDGWGNVEINEKNYPNNYDCGMAALDKYDYSNEIYVYVPADEGKETGTLTFGMENPSRIGKGGKDGNGSVATWVLYKDYAVTYYKPEFEYTLKAKYGTLVLPFDATLPAGLTLYSDVTEKGEYLTLTPAEGDIVKNTPYIVQGTSGATYNISFSEVPAITETSCTNGNLTGVLEETTAPEGSYVLQNGTDGVGFYAVVSAYPITVPANRVYVELENAAGANLRFLLPGDETAIDATAAEDGVVDVYHINGTLVKKGVKAADALNDLPKGMYIVGGKKVTK